MKCVVYIFVTFWDSEQSTLGCCQFARWWEVRQVLSLGAELMKQGSEVTELQGQPTAICSFQDLVLYLIFNRESGFLHVNWLSSCVTPCFSSQHGQISLLTQQKTENVKIQIILQLLKYANLYRITPTNHSCSNKCTPAQHYPTIQTHVLKEQTLDNT